MRRTNGQFAFRDDETLKRFAGRLALQAMGFTTLEGEAPAEPEWNVVEFQTRLTRRFALQVSRHATRDMGLGT